MNEQHNSAKLDGADDGESSRSRTKRVEEVKDGAALVPYFDAAGRFIHHCKCGREASFGFGVYLRKGRLGTWYCTVCKPPVHRRWPDIILRTAIRHNDGEIIKNMDTALQKPSFVYDGAPHPVELLRDQRGVYGIGVSDLYDFEAIAWSCGIEPEPHTFERAPRALILRPDRLLDTRPHGAVLQRIAGGFRCGPFMRTHEEQLRRFIHHEVLNRAGLTWPPPSGNSPSGLPQWWSADKKQQARNRGIYHGLRQLSLHIVNHLIGAALEAADADAVEAARRFAFPHRESIYRAGALSHRALQLTETFPVLALAIYAEDWRVCHYGERRDAAELGVRKNEAIKLLLAGARLRELAGAMGIPMALRRIRPGVAHLASEIFWYRPGLLRAMPNTAASSRIWLRVVPWAHNRVSAEFAEWAARQVPQIPGTLNDVGCVLGNIADWVRAGMPPDPDRLSPKQAGRQFVVRPFTPSMSLKTAMRLSADWHEAIANNLDGPNSAFPNAWYPAARLGNYEILPIEDAASLYREGTAMHHCVGTYGDHVQLGNLYIYSIRRNGERLATLALGRHNGRAYLEQIRGPCNTNPPNPIVATVQRWLRAQKPLPTRGSVTALRVKRRRL